MKTLPGISLILLLLNGFLALLGGIPMVLEPSGALNQMPLDWLKGSPFPDYLIPGIFLSTAIGLFSLLTAYASFLHYRYASYLTMAVGFILVVWIIVQMHIIPVFSLLQPVFMLVGLILVVTGFIQKKQALIG